MVPHKTAGKGLYGVGPYNSKLAMHKYDEYDHVKEVYARFGLAVYFAQVLEHGLVNALVILDLIPARCHLARSRDQWGGRSGRLHGSPLPGDDGPDDEEPPRRDSGRSGSRTAPP